MSNKFLLPCECGRSVAVEISQAGQHVACACGKKLAVPSLRSIRKLAPAAEQSGQGSARGAAWNPVKGILFAIGALLVIGGLGTAGYSFLIYQRADAFQPSAEAHVESLALIDSLSPLETFEAWHHITEHGLEPAGSSPFAQAQEVAAEKRWLVKFGLSIALAGLVCALAPTIFRGKQ